MTQISEDQAARMTTEYQQLAELAAQQLREHKLWLKDRMHTLMFGKLPVFGLDLLLSQVNDIKLETIYAEPTVTQLVKTGEHTVAKPTLSIVYTYPDELFDFLTADTTPEELRNSLASANVDGLEKQAFTMIRLPDTKGARKL